MLPPAKCCSRCSARLEGQPFAVYRRVSVQRNEDDHPFFALLSSVQSSTAIPVNTIDLDALTKPQTQQLVCSLLPLEDDGLHELVDEVYSKSAGNPFLVKQILQKLYEDGSLSFSPQRLRWQYRGEAERETALPQGVIELVRERIKRLPGQTVEALKLAACLKQPLCDR